jgi:hypothetical protein
MVYSMHCAYQMETYLFGCAIIWPKGSRTRILYSALYKRRSTAPKLFKNLLLGTARIFLELHQGCSFIALLSQPPVMRCTQSWKSTHSMKCVVSQSSCMARHNQPTPQVQHNLGEQGWRFVASLKIGDDKSH